MNRDISRYEVGQARLVGMDWVDLACGGIYWPTLRSSLGRDSYTEQIATILPSSRMGEEDVRVSGPHLVARGDKEQKGDR